ncbi:MAG: hypothetical protein IJC82_01300, partial [Firmicutes bacterium]|nr:hypothetical protein [Bacillota bacterium]
SVMSDIIADFSLYNISLTSSFVVSKLVKLTSKSILKFNALTVAHKHQLNRAVDRASELGKLVEVLTKAVKDEF